jgi:hypothetical protein
MLVMGYLQGPGGARVDCESPLRVMCRDCDHTDVWSCQGHRESRCRPCSARYRRRVRAIAESGHNRGGGYHYLLTLTAPGDAQHRFAGGRLICRCTPAGGVDLPSWNASHSKRWNHFRTRLKQEVPALQFFRGVEVQARGALHDHAMVWSPVALSKAHLREVAMDAGFGHSVDLAPVVPGSKKAAYYVAKYVTKATDSRDDVPWLGQVVDVETGEVTEAIVPGRYRTWSMSQYWGMKMSRAREQAAEYARLKRFQLARLADDQAMAAVTAVMGHVELVPAAANDP